MRRAIPPHRLAFALVVIGTAVLGACTAGQPPLWLQQRAALTDGKPSSDAEAVFAEAYRLEQRASFGQAVQYYNLVIDRFPGSPLVGIAQERVAQLAGQQAVAVAEPAALAPGDYACTVAGLYPKQARWCGVVRQLRYPYYLVEVSQLSFNSLLAFWFSRSTCTGDRLLTWWSQGEQVWVPRSCLAEPLTGGVG
jgi:hypothetical protein